jgi:hypothetical protein
MGISGLLYVSSRLLGHADNCGKLICILNSDVGRTLTAGGYNDDTLMTIETCISYCSNRGLQYAGLEYYHECCMCHSQRHDAKRGILTGIRLRK